VAVALGGGWRARERENRIVGFAALASLLLHALLLVSFPGLLERKRLSAIPERLTARLVAPKPEPAPPAPRAEEPPEPQPAKPRPQAEEPRKSPAKPAAKPAPAPKPEPAQAPVRQAAQTPAPPTPVASVTASETGIQAKVEPQPAAPAPSPDEAGLIAKFRLDIIAQAKRFKRYPRLAMENNWEGRADVRIVFGADGRRVSIGIARSSGHEALDKQALDTLTKAFVPVPAALRGKEFAVEIPVIYSLKDENA
jgi:protein TonB